MSISSWWRRSPLPLPPTLFLLVESPREVARQDLLHGKAPREFVVVRLREGHHSRQAGAFFILPTVGSEVGVEAPRDLNDTNSSGNNVGVPKWDDLRPQ